MGSIDKFRNSTREETNCRDGEPPDVVFLADFLVSNLLRQDQNFNIEEKRLTEAIADLPKDIRSLVKGWVLVYLAWLFKVYVFKKYGMEITNILLSMVREKLQEAPGDYGARLWPKLEYWFGNLDRVTNGAGKGVSDWEVPFEVLVALCFMVFDADSPYYKDLSGDTTMVEFDIGFLLGSAAREAKDTIRRPIDRGRPAEEAGY